MESDSFHIPLNFAHFSMQFQGELEAQVLLKPHYSTCFKILSFISWKAGREWESFKRQERLVYLYKVMLKKLRLDFGTDSIWGYWPPIWLLMLDFLMLVFGYQHPEFAQVQLIWLSRELLITYCLLPGLLDIMWTRQILCNNINKGVWDDK